MKTNTLSVQLAGAILTENMDSLLLLTELMSQLRPSQIKTLWDRCSKILDNSDMDWYKQYLRGTVDAP